MSNTSTNDLLKSSQQLYINGEYEKAIELLEGVKGELSAKLYNYNIGTLYLKNNDVGQARYFLEKAKSLDPLNMAIRSNLDTLKAQNSLAVLERPIDPVGHLYQLLGNSSLQTGLTISLVFVLIFTLLKKFKVIKPLWAYLLLVAISLIPVGVQSLFQYNYETAVVLRSSAGLEGPSNIFEKNVDLPEGIKIIIKVKDETWARVVVPRPYAGWVEMKNLRSLRE